jgi:putative YphP/YqiW family bacilliredoxin
MYPPEMTDPIRAQARAAGFTEALTSDQVDAALATPGTALVFVNSVCGCAGGSARPGIAQALADAAKKPDRTITVFAGVDREATDRARAYFGDVPPSSPSMALVKDGKPVWTLSRHQIQGRTFIDVANDVKAALAQHC